MRGDRYTHFAATFGMAALVLCQATACVGPEPVAPSHGRPFTPQPTVVKPAPGALTVTMTLTHDTATDDSATLGPFNLPTRAIVAIHQSIKGTFNQQPTRSPFYIDPRGIFSGGTCYSNAKVQFRGYSFVPQPCVVTDWVGNVETDIDTTVVLSGTGTVYRASAVLSIYLGACANPCVYYDGSTTVTISPTSSELSLAATPSTVARGGTIQFLASTSSADTAGITMWTFVSDDSATVNSNPCPAGTNPCNTSPPTPGTMYVTATIRGIVEQASVHVFVYCPSGDSLSDKEVFRNAMAAAWAKSNADSGESKAKEQVGLFLYDPDTHEYRYFDATPFAVTTACSDSMDLARVSRNLPFGFKIVGWFHTHPMKVGTTRTCGDLPTVPFGFQGHTYNEGPSEPDWMTSASISVDLSAWLLGGPIPGYIADPFKFWVFNGLLDEKGNWSHKTYPSKPYNPKSPSGC